MKELLAFLVAATAAGAGIYATLKKPGGSLSGARRRRRSGGLRGEAEARELELYCDNDGDLYRQQRQPIEKNLERKIQKGTYDHQKAKKLWGYLADSCAKKYAKEHGSPGVPWHKMFSTADRRQVASNMADFFKSEYDLQHRVLHGRR